MKTFAMQRIDEYKDSDTASSLKARDYKDATDLIMHTHNSTEHHAVCIGNGQVNQPKGSEKVGALNCMHDQQAVLCGGHSNFIVRRLTPLECERLQGFPDGWTDIGDWTDEDGKVHKQADTPRYKALGNSIALPFWQYLARRIVAQYEHEVTMGSLFSGIGGFELVFQRCGAEPLWSSEIEPFCKAVLRERFPADKEDESTDDKDRCLFNEQIKRVGNATVFI